MKLNKIINISAGVALVLGSTACSSDYLDLKPESSLTYEEALVGEEGATMAVTGLCQMMYKQYQSLSDGSVGFNGEPELLMYYGEVMGQDYVSIYWNNYFGGVTLLDWTQMDSSLYNGANNAWSYCYQLISQANNIISFAPKKTDAEGNEKESSYGIGTNVAFNPDPDVTGTYAFRYAQALTFRAHAYIHLMQIYCSRYEDRYVDEATGEYQLTVPLRLKYRAPEESQDFPLARWDDLMNQIYADLSQALSLYELSGMNRSYNFEPDAQIAKGLFARIAMINHDWDTAIQMAGEAREGYPIMTMDEYQAGFAAPTSEWMWTNSNDAQGVYFYSFGSMYACNGTYIQRWNIIGAGGMDQMLASKAQTMDNRRKLYYSPGLRIGNARAMFWNKQQCNSETMDINGYGGALHNDFFEFASQKYEKVRSFGTDFYPPYTFAGNPGEMYPQTTMCAAVFGAQFKFWGLGSYSTSNFPFMRASEMALIQAEAAYENGDYAEANQYLAEVNSMRIDNYNGNYSGEELREQIRLCRRLELWGEGFNWFDFKRWNVKMERVAWKEGDQNSGNWPQLFSGTFEPTKNRGWRWRIPTSELNYNHAIDYNEAVGGDDVGEN